MAVGTDRYDSMKNRAAKLVREAVKRGELSPAKDQDCVDCGNAAEFYDHRDYTKPLDVVPVCRSCNRKRGPAINAPEDVGSTKRVKQNDKIPANDEEKFAEFPGHCFVDVNDDLIEANELLSKYEHDPDASTAYKMLWKLPKTYRSVA